MKKILILLVLILCIGLVFFFVPLADEWLQLTNHTSVVGK